MSLLHRPGLIVTCTGTDDFCLVDSGDGRKLERYGSYLLDRPEAQALWRPRDSSLWTPDAVFDGKSEEGRWRFSGSDLPETWNLTFDGLSFLGRFTSFRHVGVFYEQSPHWHDLQHIIRSCPRRPHVLNLFAYTGVASLVAARAGASVTHVDASRKAIGWAKENQKQAGLDESSVRWICDDATKFCERETRRGSHYDIILIDPPAFGRGPKGEVWQLFDDLPRLLTVVRELQQPNNSLMTILTSYAIRSSSFMLHELMRQTFDGFDGAIESGELVLREEGGDRTLSTSLFSRFVSKNCELPE